MPNWIFEEFMYSQRRDALNAMNPYALEARLAYDAEHHGLRGVVAGAFVRFGLMLDRVAGQRAATLSR